MADTKTIAPGVTRNDTFWGHVLEGSKDALVSAGLAQESWFADWTQRDKAGHTIRSKRLVDQGRLVHTTRPARGLCAIWIIQERHGVTPFRREVDPKCERFLIDLLTTTAAVGWANKKLCAEVEELYRPGRAQR